MPSSTELTLFGNLHVCPFTFSVEHYNSYLINKLDVMFNDHYMYFFVSKGKKLHIKLYDTTYFTFQCTLYYLICYLSMLYCYLFIFQCIILHYLSAVYCYLFTFQCSICLVLCNWNRATFSISKFNLTFSPSVIFHIYNFFLDGFKLLSFIQVMFYIFLKRKKKHS